MEVQIDRQPPESTGWIGDLFFAFSGGQGARNARESLEITGKAYDHKNCRSLKTVKA
ncbi:hypothetical protein M6D81_03855 [Paenibacillus sp. J5C_2022]|nr:hypothetical protein [Paenibacillus sp. J5C2022]